MWLPSSNYCVSQNLVDTFTVCGTVGVPAELQGGRQEPGEGGGVHDGEGDGEREQEVGQREGGDEDVARRPQLGPAHRRQHHRQVTRHCRVLLMLLNFGNVLLFRGVFFENV